MTDFEPEKGVTFTDVLFRGGWKGKEKKIILTLALCAIVGVGSVVGSQMLLTQADQSVSAAQGHEYVGSGYRVLFPGEPTVSSRTVPGTSAMATMEQWSNKQKLYQVIDLPDVNELGTLQGMLQGSVAASGAAVVESHPVKISGGTALAAHLRASSSDMWVMAVIADDRSHALSVLQSGEQRDDAFFDSLKLR
ncbi:hypothetical protein LXM50_13110 [Microbacterium sp. Au-Mic1]|uniref:hypothetical protein n=1 Tax=Microbacterium sp. Au-Mic1 TaxID=2906457 RepID=UPI001E401561|nr:hypothetical protein [Microbacterium sp. Au-Mic1]MCE4026912.1 hypothetical protein [Microbacterium sp. Au-Mic1]